MIVGKKEDKKAEDILNEDVGAGAKAEAAAAEEVEAAENENAVPEDGVGIEQAAADIIAKMQQQEATITTLEDQVKRQMAEFDNFRKRTEREKTDMFDLGAIDVVKKLLPIVDNFERSLAIENPSEEVANFLKGYEMIYKQIMTLLENQGVKVIEAEGKEFDPNFHQAVMTVSDENFKPGMVVEELQKGYMLKDRVIRASLVKVSE